jgi:DNA-binding FadR family transcriptional regulator
MLGSLKPLRQRLPLHQEVQEAIKRYIIGNGLQPGDSLPAEVELADRLGVSRNSVREAAKALESLNIIEIRHGSGLFVGSFSIDALLDNLPYGLLMDLKDLRDLLDVRRVLESGMIESALRVMSDHQIADLERLVEEMRLLAEHGQTFLEQDRTFHQKLYEGLDNSALLKVIDVFWLAYHRTSTYANIEDREPMHTYQDHVAILDAVKTGDAQMVRNALEQHHWGIITRLERAQEGDRT